MTPRYPLRFVIPFAILIAGGVIVASAWMIESTAQKRSVMQFAEQQLRSNASFIAAEVEAAIRNQDQSEVRAAVERAISNPSVRSLYLVDTDGQIRYSSSSSVVGEPFAKVDSARDVRDRLADVPATSGVLIASDFERDRVMGRFPVHMRGMQNDLMPVRNGAIYIVFDLSRQMAEHQAALATRMVRRAVIVLLLASLFWLVLRSMLLQRIEQLIHSVREVGRGNYDVSADIGGGDEIGELGRELDSMAVSLRDQTQHLNYLADHDALTGLLNRTGIEAAIERALSESRARSAHFALCLMDIDSLRVINDTQGHMAGDELLRRFALLLEDALPNAVALARVGGDEFAALIDLDHGESLQEIGQGLASQLQSFRFERRGERFGVQATTGIIQLSPELDNSGSALGAADAACYHAKETQPGGVFVGQTDVMHHQLLQGSMRWVSRIQEALDEDRFALYAQRIHPLGEGPHAGLHFEILVRMVDRDGTIQPPGQFLEAAERYNLIGRLDRWVLLHALEWLESQGDRLKKISTCSINLSGVSLGDPGLLTSIESWLKAHPSVDPKLLCLEVTETAAIRNLDQALSFVTRLRTIGCRFALDDFGTGLSSFEYLKQLPVDLVKIDGIFVRDIVSDSVDRAIVKAIHEIATQVGMRTIAEFVENVEIMNELTDIGVHYGQGYGIARPAPIETVFEPIELAHPAGTGPRAQAN